VVHELTRYLAETLREEVLATPEERRRQIPPDLEQILQLEEWHHPDLANGEVASQSETFRQLAEVLSSGDPSRYAPAMAPNSHWSNWPEGGLL